MSFAVAPFLAHARLYSRLERLQAQVAAFDRATTKALQDYRVEQARQFGGEKAAAETKKRVEERGFVWGRLGAGRDEVWWELEERVGFWEREVRRAELRAERVMEGVGFFEEE